MATRWFLENSGDKAYSFQDLVALVQEQELRSDDLVRADWSPAWQRACEVVGLFRMASRSSSDECLEPSGKVDGEPQEKRLLELTLAPQSTWHCILERFQFWRPKGSSCQVFDRMRTTVTPELARAIVTKPQLNTSFSLHRGDEVVGEVIESPPECSQQEVAGNVDRPFCATDHVTVVEPVTSGIERARWDEIVRDALKAVAAKDRRQATRSNSSLFRGCPVPRFIGCVIAQLSGFADVLAPLFGTVLSLVAPRPVRRALGAASERVVGFRYAHQLIRCGFAAVVGFVTYELITSVAATEALRFPSWDGEARAWFPGLGPIKVLEYRFLLADAVGASVILGYFGVMWLEANAEG